MTNDGKMKLSTDLGEQDEQDQEQNGSALWSVRKKSSDKVAIMFWFGLLGFMGYQPLIGYFMPNLVYIYISNIYDL